MGTAELGYFSRAELVFPTLSHEPGVIERKIPAARPARTEHAKVAKSAGHILASVLTFATIHRHGDMFVNFLKARHATFIEQKGWALPEIDGMEFDQYDTPLVSYIVIHEYGEILAGIRLSPTTARVGAHSYMIRDAQLGMLSGLPFDVLYFEAPVSSMIWEASRLFISQDVPSHRRAAVQALLMTKMAETARAGGASQVIGIVPSVFRRWLQRIGMNATPIGPEIEIDGDKTCAALFNLEE